MTEDKLKEVKEFVEKKTCNIKDLQHDCEHAKRVAQNAKQIAQILGLDKQVDMNLLQVTCLLHDINHAIDNPGFKNYFFESKRLKKVLPSVLEELNIDEDERKIIENAIYKSPLSYPFKRLNKNTNLYTQILQDADTLDLFSKERTDSFDKVKGKIFFYKILSPLSNFYFNYGRKNLSKYLNFPHLAKEFYV